MVLISQMLLLPSAHASQTCSRFGNNLTQTSAATRSGIFVNVSTPVSCSGNATRWNICYYNSSTDASTTTLFSVYRPSAGTYYLVNGSLTNYTIARNSSNTYTCTQFAISQQYTVLAGDIIVVCVQNASSGRLGIAGNVTGTSVLQNPSASCTSLATSLRTTSGYNLVGGITLHANIGKNLYHCAFVYQFWVPIHLPDINECAANNGGCAQVCTDLTLGNNCSCLSGFMLDGNGASCSGKRWVGLCATYTAYTSRTRAKQTSGTFHQINN